ncbi:hypothetical protein [Sphingomonas glacialis]|uniref:hypothetical protein n=1 Tax=Sphingomonas glacialis TaxID=658225 RepID=UPI0013869B77|nr:hypothetical protein [Sphingomonas glacialis]
MTQHRLPRTPKKLDQIPGQRGQDEQAIAMILALTAELSIVRARLDTCERLLVEAGVFKPDAIETFTPDAAALAEREQLRTRSIAKILRPLHELAQQDLATVTGVAHKEQTV